jgi:hypothetical protein
MLLFKFEDVLLTALGQQPGNTIWTYQQLFLAVHGDGDPVVDLAISGDILNYDDRYPFRLWEDLFRVSNEGSFFQGDLRFTKDREQAAVFREVRRIICAKYPWTTGSHTLLREAIASSLSFAFLAWIQQANRSITFLERSDMPTLYQHLCAQNLAA